MKKLIIYYSLSGNTKLIAESIAEALDAELLALKTQEEFGASGFMKYFRGGSAVMKKEKPLLRPYDKNIQDYDVLFIGTPVWAWSYTPALNTFFSTTTLKDKKVALFCCHGGGKGKIFEKMKEALSGNHILGTIDFMEPLRKNKEENIEKAKSWAKEVISSEL